MPEGAGKVVLGVGVLMFVAWVLDRIINVLSNPFVGIPVLLLLGGGIAAFVRYNHRRSRV